MKQLFVIMVLMLVPTLGWAQADLSTARVDSVPSYWGPVPARADSTSALFADQSRPGWEKAVMVPYYVVGIPFRIVNFVGRESVEALDRWGIFSMPPSEHVGLPLPLGIYFMPDGGISGLEGFSYGGNFRRPDFLGPDNLAFLTLMTSTLHADKIAGGFYFNLDRHWGLQLGAGSAELPLTKYYGLGYGSTKGDRSYYNRKSKWVGAELDRDLMENLSLELRSFFSQVEARESGYEVDQGLGTIHADDLPPGYPGDSSGWTWKIGLIRNAANDTGRPQARGFQKASFSYFQGTDDPDLSFVQYFLDVQHFFPLWHTERTLGLRGFMNRMYQTGSSEIPLTRMVTMYHPNSLRGFSDLRFYGLGNLGFSGEYRWPVWVAKGRKGLGMDAYLFSDVGQVYNHTNEVALNHFELTGGVGLRFIGSDGDFRGRCEVGFSDEGTIWTLTFSQTFQHHNKGLLYGKDPTRRP